MKKCECCLGGDDKNKGCGNGDKKMCTRYSTGIGSCSKHGSGTNDDNNLSLFF